jgi:hypothetical protein
MRTYTFSEARQNFALILDQAQKEGSIQINRRDGQAFIIKPTLIFGSPLDIKGINLSVSTDEIIDIVRKSRERTY